MTVFQNRVLSLFGTKREEVTYLYTYIYIYIYIYIYVCVCVCVCVYSPSEM